MHKIWAVTKREFLDKVRTKAFVIGTILFPVIMVGMTLLPVFLERRETEPKRIAVVDAATGDVGAKVTEALAAAKREGQPGIARYSVSRVPAQGRADAVRDSLVALTGVHDAGAESLDGILVLTDESVDTGRIPYLGVNVGSMSEMRKLESELQTALRQERLRRAGIDVFVGMKASRPVDVITQKVTSGKLTGESGTASFLLAYIMGFVLYIAMILYGVQVMNSVMEEKVNRIAEVLASSVKPFELMLGKILGVCGAALLQLGLWGTTAMLVTTYRVPLGRLVGASPESLSSMKAPNIQPDLLAVFLVYFVLGFMLFAAVYAAVAAMCNSQQEAQQAVAPVNLCIVAGFLAMFALLSEPTGSLARTLSLIPILAPFVVPVRYSLAPVPAGELLLSVGLLVASVLLVAWIAGRIYRVGILSYGKKPKLKELWAWVRA